MEKYPFQLSLPPWIHRHFAALQHCTVMHCTALHCTVLHCTAALQWKDGSKSSSDQAQRPAALLRSTLAFSAHNAVNAFLLSKISLGETRFDLASQLSDSVAV
jgi:hypothetical protein